jgi:hypothetical protein
MVRVMISGIKVLNQECIKIIFSNTMKMLPITCFKLLFCFTDILYTTFGTGNEINHRFRGTL